MSDVFQDGAVMDALFNPFCFYDRGLITDVMQQNAYVWFYSS